MSLSNNYPIYKSLYGLTMLKKQMKFTPMGKEKQLNTYLNMYNKAIKEAKEYKAKAPSTSSTKDLFIAGATAGAIGSTYTNPNAYTNKNEWDEVIKELTACKKYLENELKHLESCFNKDITTIIESLFDFELE